MVLQALCEVYNLKLELKFDAKPPEFSMCISNLIFC